MREHGPSFPRCAPGTARFRIVPRRGAALRLLALLSLAACAEARAQSASSSDRSAARQRPAADAWEAAGPPDLLAKSWTTADGLPQNTVNDMTTTPDGHLWVVTFGGIARFDGLGFEVFDLSRLPEMGSNRWVSVMPTDDGVILGSEGGDLIWFDGESRVQRIPGAARVPSSRGGLVPDGKGGFWQVASRVLRHWDGERWRTWGPDEGLDASIPALTVDRSGRPWLAQANGVSRLDGSTLRLVVPADRVGGRTWGLHEDGAGRIWLAAESGLWLLGPDEIPRNVELGPDCEPPVSNVSSRGSVIWIVTRSGACRLELVVGDPLRPRVTFVSSVTMNPRSWEAIHVDMNGSAWMGSSGSGLRRFAAARARRWTVEKGLPPFRSVQLLVGDGAGGLWLGMGCSGLVNVGAAGVRTLPGEEVGLPSGCIRALLREPDGDLWVGTFGGLSRLSVDGSVRTWAPEGDWVTPQTHALARDLSGRIWASFGSRIAVIGSDEELRWLNPGMAAPRLQEIRALYAAPDGAVWAGGDATVHRMVLREGAAAEWTTLTQRDGIPPGGVRTMRIDERGRLWVGTYGGGLAILGGNGPNGRITARQGLFDNAVSELLEDERGRLWILGNRGVAVVDPAQVDSVLTGAWLRLDGVVFGEESGVPEGNGGSPAAVLDPAGRAWFATIDGAAGIDARAFPGDTTPLAVRVATVESANRDVRPGTPWVIHGAAGELVIRYLAPSLPAAGQTRFRYRLVGYDERWVDAGSERHARYTNLDAGSYRFEVLSRNRDGVWDQEPASIQVRIEPFWWQRAWLRWTVAAAALVLGTLLFFRRIRTVEERNLRLENTIRARDEAEERARRRQRELEHVSRVAAAGELATSIAHELNQPLMAIVSNAAASDQLLSNPDLGKEAVREALRDIVSESRRASDVIRSLRSFLQRRAAEHVPLAFESVIGDVLGLLRGEIRESRIQLRVDLSPGLPQVRGDAVQLQQVFLNLIINALEAMRDRTPRGARMLTIEVRPAEGGLEATVRDSGPGLGPEAARRLFEPFFTTKESGMGIGLGISRTLLEAHGGRIAASNAPDGGAEFRVFLPAADALAAEGALTEEDG